MFPQIETLLQQIGAATAAGIAGEWNAAWILVKVQTDVISVQGRVQAGAQVKSFLVSKQVIALFKTLHTEMAQSEKIAWKSARFDLQRSGKFDLKLQY